MLILDVAIKKQKARHPIHKVVLTKLRLILNITTDKSLLCSQRVQDESKIINMLVLITSITR